MFRYGREVIMWSKIIIAIVILGLSGTTASSAPKQTLNQLSFDGDGMVDAPGMPNTLPRLVSTKLGSGWNISDFSHAGDTIAAVIAGEATVNGSYSKTHPRNELVIWAGTDDGLEGDTGAAAANEMVQYLTTELAVGWRVTFIAMLPRRPSLANPNIDMVRFRSDYNFAMWTWCQANNVRYLDPTQGGQLEDYTDQTYYSDGVHLTLAGQQIVANQLYLLIK
jgi:GDSL-like lipase/acylhydrolase family protein